MIFTLDGNSIQKTNWYKIIDFAHFLIYPWNRSRYENVAPAGEKAHVVS